MTYLFPYSAVSKSARTLCDLIPATKIKRDRSRFRPAGQTVINWGSQDCPAAIVTGCKVINPPDKVAIAANKLSFFRATEGTDLCVAFTTDVNQAKEWIAGGSKVCCRAYLGASGGAGMTIASTVDQLVEVPLYTKYVPKQEEFRVHVMGGKTFAVQRKARRKDIPDNQVNWHIRNHDNGFVFAHNNITYPDAVKQVAEQAMVHIKLDFGAVDVLLTKKGRAKVIEVNSAPGLEGWTAEQYALAFKEIKVGT